MVIKCPECKKEISDKVAQCPNCGVPINNVNANSFSFDIKEYVKGHMMIYIVAIVILIGIIIWCSQHIGNDGEDDFNYSSSSNISATTEDYNDAWLYLKISGIDIEHNSSYTVATGVVTNNGSSTYDFVKVKGSFVDRSGATVDTDWTYAVGQEGLEPGESTTFRLSVSKNVSIVDCKVSIMD